jgi:hypothetical protein
MEKEIIKFCYRKMIDSQSTKPWEKLVFEDSYAEFRLQMQNFNEHAQYLSYGELVHYVPDAAQLSWWVAPAITGYIQQLNQVMPDILNNLGRRFLLFEHFQFEIINSHFSQKERHQVAVNFYSVPLVWHQTIGNYMLLSFANDETSGEVNTQLLQLQPYLSICSLQKGN